MDDVHFRLYDSKLYGPAVICVQWFDYQDYDEQRFLNGVYYETEAEANDALAKFLWATERNPGDAPVWMRDSEASAWASGWNAAVEAADSAWGQGWNAAQAARAGKVSS